MDAFEPEVGIATLGRPSATGDIEGVLIHGAQGVRSSTVVLTG
jgi:L-lactate utilization protein LutC